MDQQIIPQQNISISGIPGAGELSLYQYFIASPLFAGFVNFESNERKIFLAEFAGLSNSLRNYFASTETAVTTISMGLEFGLDDHQISQVAETIRELLTGKIFIKDFPLTISSKFGIDDMKAGGIANKLISSFGPIIEDIKRIQRSKFPDKIQQLQKESRPETMKEAPLTQPSAKPAPIRQTPTPAQEFIQRQAQSFQPATNIIPPPVRPPAPPSVTKPPEVGPQRKDLEVQPLRQSSDTRNQFKVPDLSSFGSAQNKSFAKTPSKQPVNAENKQDKAEKSLEEELQKVASVIDLRTGPKNQSSNE